MLRHHNLDTGDTADPPVSKTMQYKKITKPLLETSRHGYLAASSASAATASAAQQAGSRATAGSSVFAACRLGVWHSAARTSTRT